MKKRFTEAQLEIQNTRLKKLLADALLENEVTREVLRKSGDRTRSTRGGAGGCRALQTTLDRFLQFYNYERPHRGYRLNGRTPATVFAGAVAA